MDSPKDDPVIVVDDSDKDEEDEVHTTTNAEIKDTSVPKSLKSINWNLRRTKLKLKLLSLKHNPPFLISLPTELKDLPFKFNEHIYELEIKLPRDSKEIPNKLEDFTKTVTSLTSQVAELKTL
nr:hypothetical protein [Tanacetum cinerariifolium]